MIEWEGGRRKQLQLAVVMSLCPACTPGSSGEGSVVPSRGPSFVSPGPVLPGPLQVWGKLCEGGSSQDPGCPPPLLP